MVQGTLPAEARISGLDPISLVQHASGPVLVVLCILMMCSVAVWVIWLLKALQLGRLRNAQHSFERAAETIERPDDLVAAALRHRTAPGARVVLELAKRHDAGAPGASLLLAVAKRAIATEQQKASSLMPSLSSIASASPFIGLFGTVVGIINAFELIGIAKSASLPVVAPAIGEALFATAVGLFAAIPATIGYNFVDKRIGDLIEEITASAEAWVEIMAGRAVAGVRTRPGGGGEPTVGAGE
ncbi:MAG: MotA/TolQ/ExbB proton channel family protein [Polyangiaceae bacterium]|nr:MotA/TolQ/ExbB proton channel family protein [Polyangiaceae bacterium]